MVDIMAALSTVVHAFTSFHNPYKSHWKTSLQNMLFKRNHSPFLLTFSFVFFFPVFSDVLFSFAHILHSTFPIYISLPWLALLHFMRVRPFFFHFFSVLSLVSSQCITSKYKKKHFVECQSLHGYDGFVFFN